MPGGDIKDGAIGDGVFNGLTECHCCGAIGPGGLRWAAVFGAMNGIWVELISDHLVSKPIVAG
jgi:hypothetical protein